MSRWVRLSSWLSEEKLTTFRRLHGSPTERDGLSRAPNDPCNRFPEGAAWLPLVRFVQSLYPTRALTSTRSTNPGGPGGSGTAAVASYGRKLAAIVEGAFEASVQSLSADSVPSGRYNVLSWDPRSVNLTAPALGCFSTDGNANRFVRDIEHLGLPFGA